MAYALYILLISICFTSQGLRCRLEQDTKTQDEFEDIVRNCLRQENEDMQKENHDDVNKGYTRNDEKGKTNESGKKSGAGDNYQKDEEEYDYKEYDTDSSIEREKKMQRKPFSQNNQKYRSYQNQGFNQTGNRRNQGSRNYSWNIGSPLESIEPCIIHCIFKQKKLLNQDNYIDKINSMRALTQKINNAELKEFVEDSVNECFDTVYNDNSEGKCEDSKNFALCLEEKGKNNCEDWDTNSNHTRGNGNTFSNITPKIPERSPLNKRERGRDRQSLIIKNDEDKTGDCHTRGERERSKYENSNDKTSNNYRITNPDNNEPKLKLSDYFNTRG